MSNKILFLYLTSRQKTELQKCEKILKVLFRKFRKSVVFSYMPIDVSPSCRQLFKEKLYDEIQKNHAVFICGDISREEKDIVLRDILGEYAEAHFFKSCVICHPVSCFSAENSNENIICTHTVKIKDIIRTIDTATALALQRKRKLTVCTDEGAGSFIKSEVFNSFDKSLHMEREILSFNEALYICMKSVPNFDVVLSAEQVAVALKMHIICTIPDGFSLFYTENGKVYTRQTLPYEQMDNSPLFSALIAFSAMLEMEFDMKSAADWLRRSSAFSFETHRNTDSEDFIQKVISEIEKPMRKHTR